jgi:hypothetical protein
MTQLLGAFRSLIIQRVCCSFPLPGSILSTTAQHLPSSHQPITQKRTLDAVMDYHFEELESPMAPPASARNHKPLYLNICLRGIESLETQDRDAIISRTSMTALLPLIGCWRAPHCQLDSKIDAILVRLRPFSRRQTRRSDLGLWPPYPST